MVIDTLKNSNQYHSLHPGFKKAFEYLSSTDFSKTENATYELDGKNIYAIVSEYDTKPVSDGKWESHLKYYDIQFVAKGEELMGYVNKDYVTLSQDYNDENDFMLWEDNNEDSDFIRFKENNFMILAPEDVHMPGIETGEIEKVKKVVIKVLI